MKKILCLILALVLLMAFSVTQAEETETRKTRWEDVRLERSGTEPEGAFVSLGHGLPLQVFIPAGLADANADGTNITPELILSLFHEDTRLYVQFLHFQEPPVSCSVDTVAEFRAKGLYSDLEEINGIPALSYFFEETEGNGEIWSYEYIYYYLEDGSCLLELRYYPSEEATHIPYTLDYLRYSVSCIICAPKGVSASLAILKNCFPNGIPTIVQHQMNPMTRL